MTDVRKRGFCLHSILQFETTTKEPSCKNSVILSEGEQGGVADWNIQPSPESKDLGCLSQDVSRTTSYRRDGTADRPCWARLESVSVIPGETRQVLRLRSGLPARGNKAFRLASLRMTEVRKRGFCLHSILQFETTTKEPSCKNSVILSEGEQGGVADWNIQPSPESKDLGCLSQDVSRTTSYRRDGTADRPCWARLESVSVIPGETRQVLRLRSGLPARGNKAFLLASLRMTDVRSEERRVGEE